MLQQQPLPQEESIGLAGMADPVRQPGPRRDQADLLAGLNQASAGCSSSASIRSSRSWILLPAWCSRWLRMYALTHSKSLVPKLTTPYPACDSRTLRSNCLFVSWDDEPFNSPTISLMRMVGGTVW